MERKIFKPSEWLLPEEPKEEIQVQELATGEDVSEIEHVIKQIEENKLDIASAYGDWRNIGFAFADAFGEHGRNYFHRISCYYADYSKNECDTQFDNCLKSRGQGITLKTFFYYAKQAGINIATGQLQDQVPTLPNTLFPQLPEFLQKVVAIATSAEEKDILLLGSIVAMSACFPKLFSIYDGKKVFANLYLFITAQASAGKGRLVHCKQIVAPIHKHFRDQAKLMKQQHELEMMDYNEKKGKDATAEKPAKPPEKMLLIPANNSTTGVFQLLFENDGRGLLFETEGDTLAQAFKSDYGNYSDGFRKAFHHETISYYRRTDREYVDIPLPCLSAVLSGTPKQVSSLIPNAENGLFSRFIFYFMNVKPVWKDVFTFSTDNGLDDYFNALGEQFFHFFQSLQASPEIHFSLTIDQQQQFNTFFQQVQQTYITLKGLDYMATVRRLGLIAFRIAMILSVLRLMETGEMPSRLVCEERDFQTAMGIVKTLVIHSAKVFSELPAEAQLPKRKNQKEKFLDALPKEFNRQGYLKVATKMKIPEKTAEGYIGEFSKKGLLHHEKKDHYLNLMFKETKETEDTKE
ncbi:DUF3987 domain-containing protein [Aridibaculum aurantiacum]|uniref:DUF3987 domain-containing protein n=1 Tax=Aridibaculum aurantiacum TaxID=2810307 RepID=UPI001A95F445|nr:DUF3987 domain-containing protein [Aridibaculum aurantiacum]